MTSDNPTLVQLQSEFAETMKFLKSIIAALTFLMLLFLVYFIHTQYFEVDVVFYSAIYDVLIATVLSALFLQIFGFFKNLTQLETTYTIVVWLLLGYCIAISIPTVIDRSLSFYFLEKIHQRGGGIRADSLETIYTQEFMIEHRLIDVRLTEQLASETITIEDGCIRLTDKGETIAAASRYFRLHFLPKKRLLRNEYSSDLTDPFRNSQAIDSYKCQP